MIRLYIRVLELLGKEARLGWLLAFANLMLAVAQFAEPVLFGRIIDVLSGNANATASAIAALVGAAPKVALQLEALAESLQLDELVVITWTHDSQARLRSYELLAREFRLGERGAS